MSVVIQGAAVDDGAGGITSGPFLYRVAERFGLPVLILFIVLYWARTDVVQPLLTAHFDLIDKITEGQEVQSYEMREVGKKLDRLIELTQQK